MGRSTLSAVFSLLHLFHSTKPEHCRPHNALPPPHTHTHRLPLHPLPFPSTTCQICSNRIPGLWRKVYLGVKFLQVVPTYSVGTSCTVKFGGKLLPWPSSNSGLGQPSPTATGGRYLCEINKLLEIFLILISTRDCKSMHHDKHFPHDSARVVMSFSDAELEQDFALDV